MSFDDFFNALAQQESGGNYRAINGSTGALGKYQILPSNVNAWSRQYLGQNWTPRQFLADPGKQDALARAVLQNYFDKYGPRGAASAWYSGNPALANSTRPQPGGPSIASYVDSVMARMTGGVARMAVQSLDMTVAKQAREQKIVHQDRDDAGMGAVSAAGIDSASATGADAVGAPGASAVGAPGMAAGRTGQQATRPAGGAAPANDYTMDRSLRYFALDKAQSWIGTPYVFGGGGSAGPSRSALAKGNYSDVGFDCSGFVQYVLGQAGIKAPRLSYDQLAMGPRVAMSQLKPGDLVGFGDGGHLGIYLGNGQIIESPRTGASVRIRSIGRGEDAWGVSLAGLYK